MLLLTLHQACPAQGLPQAAAVRVALPAGARATWGPLQSPHTVSWKTAAQTLPQPHMARSMRRVQLVRRRREVAAGPAAAGRAAGEKKKKKKGSKKKAAKLEPGMAEAQCAASAAVKLLAMSGEAGRAALLAAGARQVLVPLLAAPTAVARWNARQALMLLSLAASDKRRAPDSGGSSKQSSNSSSSSIATAAVRDAGAGISGVPAGSQGQLTAADEAAAGVPDYLAMGNLPASHWQRSAPLTMPPLPVLPYIPGKRSAGAEQQHGSGPGGAGGASGGGSAGALAGAGSSGSVRPGSHQQRRISMSSAAGAVMMAASRMSISNVASSPSSAEGSTNASAGGEAVAAASSSLKVAKQGARGSSTIAVA